MNIPLPTKLVPLDEQPVEYVDDVGGLFFRAVCLKSAGDVIPQHSHAHDHVTLIASGAARVWVDGEYLGEFSAFRAIEIKASKHHIFQAREPNTRLVCCHQLNGKEYEILAETKLEA